MIKISCTVESENGIHARPAGALVQMTKCFESDINFYKDGKKANGKSILSIMSLGAKQADKLEIEISGKDEDLLAEKLKKSNNIGFNFK